MKKLLISASLLLTGIISFAQQDAMFTHYMFNTLAVNPGYAGSRDALTITGLHRSQWVSFPGAPTTQTLTLHTPIHNDQLGLGLSVLNDKIGPTNTTAIYADFAYKLKLNEKAKLAFGLKGGINLRSNGLSSLALDETNDDAFANDVVSDVLPNFGFGLYYYTDKYYVGLSTPKLLENNFTTNTVSGSLSSASEKRHYFLIAGTVFPITDHIKLKPTGFMKVTEAAPIEGDITLTALFKEKLWAGVMFRTGDALGLLVGANITDQLSLGYSFDWSYTNTTFKYNAGSHELMLRYDLIYNNAQRIRSPRYF
jgi:type IX secretion system PorP/SprF family membrane protein